MDEKKMPSPDILQYVERFITAFCGFFLSVALSLRDLIWHPRTAPKRLNTQLNDAGFQQVGALTLTFFMFAAVALTFFVWVGKLKLEVKNGSLAHYLVTAGKGDLDWTLITVIVFAIVSTGCMDFLGRIMRHLRPWDGSAANEEENRERRGETRFALVIPTLVATLGFGILAWLLVRVVNNWNFSDWPIFHFIVALVVFGIVESILLILYLDIWYGHRSKILIYVIFPLGYVASVAAGTLAALTVVYGVLSEELADVADIHIMSPLCSIASPKPHLSVVILNTGKTAAAFSSFAHISVRIRDKIEQIPFDVKTADSDKQPGGIIVVKAGDAVALDYIALDNAPPVQQYAGTAAGCFFIWRRYGDPTSAPRR
jgi:hypothetical protein